MFDYIVRRLLLIIPTLFGIMLLNFVIIQAAPGGPIDQLIAQLREQDVGISGRLGAGEAGEVVRGDESRAARGIDPELIEEWKAELGLDKPLHEQFVSMLGNYLTFDLGESFFKGQRVIDLILTALPVSISLGLWSVLLIYLICIPLGIAKAVRDGSKFDIYTSGVIIAGNAIPNFLFAILLIVLFAGGQYLDWFPLRGLVSDDWEELSLLGQIGDYFWHIALPVTAYVIGAFASLTLLTKNSFLEEINKQYVITARAKGLGERRVLYGHVFRNAMLIVIAGFPGAFIAILFTGSVLIETIFSLDGLGRLGLEAALSRDYPIMFATLYVFALIGLLVRLISDLTYVLVDPRIDFESREV